jgi:catechol 2,3-dioxygenase-like lactoylglutathione lyase family enzyme
MIRGIHHVAMVTRNLERILRFYREGLGFEIIRDVFTASGPQFSSVVGLPEATANVAMLRSRNLILEFFEYKAPASPSTDIRHANSMGWTHIALDVVDIDTVYHRALAAGATFHVPPQDFGELKSTYGRDPDGNIFEIQELVEPQHPLQLDVLST